MKSSLEYFIDKVWPYLPEGQRLSLTSKFELFRERANVPLPKVSTSVLCVLDAIKNRFTEAISFKVGDLSYSLIATTKNEISGLESFIESVAKQALLPKEVVICDAGSDDGTYERLESWSKTERRFLVKIIKEAGVNISQGRNIAVKQSTEKILLFTDLGTVLDSNWASYLCSAFLADSTIDYVMGYYKPIYSKDWHEALAYLLLPRWEFINPETFFASARSLAIKRDLYSEVGGFPEELSHAGEDSLFNFHVKGKARKVAFVPEAVVNWRMEPDLWKMWKSIFRYAKGDAETGFLFWGYYRELLIKVSKLGFDILIFLAFYLLAGYLDLILISSVLRFVSYPFLLFGIFRIYTLSKEYGVFLTGSIKEKFLKFLVLWYFLLAQVSGFLSGVRSR